MKKILFILLLLFLFISADSRAAVNCYSNIPAMEVVPLGSTTNPSTGMEFGGNLACDIGGVSLAGMNVPAGAMIFVIVHEYNTAVNTSAGGTLSDGVNIYIKGTSLDNGGVALKGTGMYFYSLNSQALQNNTITYTPASNTSKVSMVAFYAMGIASSNALDSAVSVMSTGSTNTNPLFSLTSGTPAQSGELFIAFMTYQNIPGGEIRTLDTVHGWGTPYTLTIKSGCGFLMNAAILGGVQVNSGTGTKIFAPVATVYGAYTNWAAWVLGFKLQQ